MIRHNRRAQPNLLELGYTPTFYSFVSSHPILSNRNRFDPYRTFKFQVVIDGRPVAGLKRTTEVMYHRDGGSLSCELANVEELYILPFSALEKITKLQTKGNRRTVRKFTTVVNQNLRRSAENIISTAWAKKFGEKQKFHSWEMQSDIGRIIALGKSPLKPAEFVIVRLSQLTA